MQESANWGADGETFFGKEIPIIESDMSAGNSLKALLNKTGEKVGVSAKKWTDAPQNPYQGYTKAGGDVFIERVPYTTAEKAGVHGRSIVTKVTLGGKHVHLDFDNEYTLSIRPLTVTPY